MVSIITRGLLCSGIIMMSIITRGLLCTMMKEKVILVLMLNIYFNL